MPPPTPGGSVRPQRHRPRRSPAGRRGCAGQSCSAAPARSPPPRPGGLQPCRSAAWLPGPAPPGHWPGHGHHRRWPPPPGAAAAGPPRACPPHWRARRGCRAPRGARVRAAAGFPAAAVPHQTVAAAGVARSRPSPVPPALPDLVLLVPRPPRCGRRRTPPSAGRPWRHTTSGSSRSPPGERLLCRGCGCPPATARRQRWPPRSKTRCLRSRRLPDVPAGETQPLGPAIDDLPVRICRCWLGAGDGDQLPGQALKTCRLVRDRQRRKTH